MSLSNTSFLYTPRHFKDIPLFKNVSISQWNDPVWQLKNVIRSVNDLKKAIILNKKQFQMIESTLNKLKSEGKEPMRITPYYLSLMQEDPFHPVMLKGEKAETRLDPIFWQSVPTPAHLFYPNAAIAGSMSEESRSYGAVYQRYPNRVAFFVSENYACASYCTHCQRAKYLDRQSCITDEDIKKGLFYINYNTNIDEVLVTGGDALRITNKRLAYILSELSRIDHLRVIRIATRVPVVLPFAVTENVLKLIRENANKYSRGLKKIVYFMTHINHYQEITEEFKKCIELIQSFGFTVRNQTVLLKHVNAWYRTLAETSRRMFWAGVHPYYLLQCHKEKGIVHFITPIQLGKMLMKHLQGWISGITKPTYAVNIEGGGGKVLLMPSGYNTLTFATDIEMNKWKHYAHVKTWDGKIISNYEALGRCTQKEFDESIKIMEEFIGRPDVFKPSLIITDNDGKPIKVTHANFPELMNDRKSELLDYDVFNNKDMPVSNPAEIRQILDDLYYQQNNA